MPAVFEHIHVVHDAEIDGQNHANNVAFVAWMQEAALAHSAAQGWPPEAYRARDLAWVVRRHEIEYFRPARSGERLRVRTWVSAMDKVTSKRRYEIRRSADNELLATAVTTWVMVNTVRESPSRIPSDVAQAFEVVSDAPQ